MFADGRPIVEITDMSLRMTGLDREALARIWEDAAGFPVFLPLPGGEGGPEGERRRGLFDPPALYDTSKILAFAIGKPSEAFGEPYRIFDEGRVIARLPGPPYQFLDRIVEVSGEPWKMVAGPRAVAEYDVPPDAWYFEADRQDRMPFAVLLETALQPCGWLAAYVGSALTSEVDLSFRNLGGSAVQVAPVGRDSGTLTTSATLTKVSKSGGMIIQQYDFADDGGGRRGLPGGDDLRVLQQGGPGQSGGHPRRRPYWSEPTVGRRAESFEYPDQSPFPDRRWGMIDRVEEFHPRRAGPIGLGLSPGDQGRRPAEWFFAAHFHQDPVCPGFAGFGILPATP